MGCVMNTYYTREEWLEARKSYIGGSDAACIVGANPWKDNVRLWEEKTGLKDPDDLSNNPAVLYGIRAEEHLRELFRWDFPQYAVFYEENNMFTNSEYPWAHYSADGWLKDKDGNLGLLEIKTTTISSASQSAHWRNQIPQNYYIQLLHGLMVTEFQFAVLKAKLRYEIEGEPMHAQIKHYFINREEIEDEIEYLAEKEQAFDKCIKLGIRPARILPEI